MDTDEPPHGNLDGRGRLSQGALIEFCRFFLSICVDQVIYMQSILEPSELVRRIEIYVEEEVRATRFEQSARGHLCLLLQVDKDGPGRSVVVVIVHF